MNKCIFRICFWVGLLFLAVGCAPAYNPDVPLGFLTKSRDYMFFCLSLLDSASPLYNQFASRYYYALFSITKVSSVLKHRLHGNLVESHHRVWSTVPSNVRNTFGEDLRKLRNKCDYQYNYNDSESLAAKDRVSRIVLNDDAFDTLIEETRKSVENYYRNVEIGYEKKAKCEKIICSIRDCREKIKKYF